MTSVKRYVPELAFQKINALYIIDPPLFKHEREVFFFILDLFFRLPAYNKRILKTEDGLIRISSKYFRKFIPKNYASYIRWLKKHDIIICDEIKLLGKAYAYDLHHSVKSKLITVEIQKSQIITRNIIRNFNRKQQTHKKQKEHILKMHKHFKENLKINTREAIAWIEEQFTKNNISIDQYNVYYISIQMIDSKDFFFGINKTNGRLDSNLTNLKSNLRQFLIGDYCQIDCRNSQPYILNFLLDYVIYNNHKFIVNNPSPNPPPYPLPSLGTNLQEFLCNKLTDNDLQRLKKSPFSAKILREFQDYKHATLNTDFYACLQSKYEVHFKKKVSRNEMKEIIYKVFFSKNKSYLAEKRIFKTLYPNVYKVIYKLKENKHNHLAICLQKIESDIFIQHICKRMVKENIIPFTIHDGIVVLAKDKEVTIEIINSVYLELINETPQFEFSNL